MSVIKIETFDVDVATAASTVHTLTNAVTLANAFVRRTTSIDKQSGPTGSTGNANANVACGAAYLSSTTQISFRQDSTTSQKIVGEVWRYTGSSGGADEFLVRGRHTITLASGSTTGSVAVSGISNVDKCIPFWTGSTQTATSVNDYDASTVSVYIDASGNIQVQRGSSTGTLVVYVTVVEFTGTNWTVGHAKSTSHDGVNETDIPIRTNSLATTGTLDVTDWSKAAIIEASLEGDTSETGLSDNLGDWTPGTTTSAVSFYMLQDSNAKNDGVSYCHILHNTGFDIHRGSNTNYGEGNGTYVSVPWPTGSSTTSAVDELALEWFSDTSGTGTAHARGRLSAQILTANTMNSWVHRSGNTVRIDYGVIDFTSIDNTVHLSVTDVDTDEVLSNTQLNVVITGVGFGATQGTGKVELVQNGDYTGTKVSQSIDTWSDTSIQVDISAGALLDSNCFLFVTSDSGANGKIGVQVGSPPETYLEALLGLTNGPSHIWTFQNVYTDSVGSATANNSSGGTPSFSTVEKICKGDSHSLELNSTTDYVSPADQTDMNTSAQSRRYIGGWIQLDSVSKTLSVIYEEGAQVNNIAFLNGFGNNLMMQIANASDDYVQLYCDVPLTANRPYHVLIEFNASGYASGVCAAYLDGVKQTRTNGNPWETPQLDSHSGNITWGHESSESLKVGDDRGVDATTIAFTSPVSCFYSHWASWSGKTMTLTEIRETVFEKGAVAEHVISSDTEANMQTAIDALADTLYLDWPCSIEIEASTAGNFELQLDNITFEDRVSMQIRYLGVDTLTLVAKNGTVLDSAKLGAPYGGTITVVNAPAVTMEVKKASDKTAISGARVLIEADTGGDLTVGTTILSGVTDGTGKITTNHRYTSDQPVVGKIRSASGENKFKPGSFAGTIKSDGLSGTVLLIKDD